MAKIVIKKSVAEEIKKRLESYKQVKNEKNTCESGDFVEKMQNWALTEENELNLGKLQGSECVEKGMKTITVPPTEKRIGYQYQRNFPENKDNIYQRKNSNETEEARMERYLRENSKILTDKNFIDLSKKEVKKLINCLRNSHAYTKEGIKVAYGRVEKNSKKTNEKELKGAKLLRDIGLEIFLLPNRFAVDKNNNERIFGDAIVLNHNHILDFKQVDGKNPGRDWKKATSQGHDVLLYITSEMDIESVKLSINDFKKHISKKRKNPIITYIYFEKSNKVFRLKYDKVGNLLSQKKKDLNGDRASTTKATISKSTLSSLNRNRTVEHIYNSTIPQTHKKSRKKLQKSLGLNDQEFESYLFSIQGSRIHKSFDVEITDITENNKQRKVEQVEKALNAIYNNKPFVIGHISKKLDFSRKYNDIVMRITDFDKNKIEKAVHSLAFTLDTKVKTSRGEAFIYASQENLTNQIVNEITEKTKKIYNFVISFFDLPEITIVRKANLIHKGKIIYNPETGEPVKKAEWDKFVEELEKMLNKNYMGYGEKIVLKGETLGLILDRLAKTNSFEAIQKKKLSDIVYKRKHFDWISDDIKNLKTIIGEPISRERAARIEVAMQSVGQRISRVKDSLKNEIQQVIIDGIKNKESKRVVSQNLFDKCVGLNRDFQKIADSEIQNTVNNAYIKEEVFNSDENEKIYFKRFEVIDDNTCPKCKKIKGKLALFSKVPLDDEHIKDEYADYAIWEGKVDGDLPIGILHAYCRGSWVRYYPEFD